MPSYVEDEKKNATDNTIIPLYTYVSFEWFKRFERN